MCCRIPIYTDCRECGTVHACERSAAATARGVLLRYRFPHSGVRSLHRFFFFFLSFIIINFFFFHDFYSQCHTVTARRTRSDVVVLSRVYTFIICRGVHTIHIRVHVSAWDSPTSRGTPACLHGFNARGLRWVTVHCRYPALELRSRIPFCFIYSFVNVLYNTRHLTELCSC